MSSDNPEKWQRIKEIFYAALPLAPAEQIQFLDRFCKDDDNLRLEVESMLASSEAAGSFMRSPAVAEVAETIADEPERLQPNQAFSHYIVISSLGRGGMGEVYLAEDMRLGRRVALKVLSRNVADDKERLRRFEQEANAASALNHPNILTVHEFGFEAGVHFLVTEFVDGETLREKIKDSSLSLLDALDIGEQVSFALLTAHASGIIHRDIKPENIMVRRDGFVKVLDFGLAKLIEPNAGISGAEAKTRALVKTKPGMIMGTASYMSPEQARGKDTDARTDTFSLGIVLYEMVTGQLPFSGETISDSIAAILTKEPPPLSRYVPDVPSELDRIIRKALAKKPAERFQTAQDLMTDLKSLRRDLDLRREIERSNAQDVGHLEEAREVVGPSQTAVDKASDPTVAVPTSDGNVVHSTSSAEYLISEVKHHKWGVTAFLSVLILAAIGLGYWYYADRSALPDAKQINSIAVLPFDNGSSDADLDYLSDGLSESLIDKLSQLPQLKVIARSSSFKYRGSNINLKEVANALGVQAVITGKVAQRGDSLIVRVEMVDALNDRQLWSEQYNRKKSDAFNVQQEIAQTVSENLRLKLSGAQEQQLAKRSNVAPVAYETLLKARFYWNKGGDEDRKKAVEYLEQAIAFDPNYALAYAELAYAYSLFGNDGILDQKDALQKAEAAAVKALELDDGLAEAHQALAFNKQLSWDWSGAEHEYKRAIELNPNYALAHATYSTYLSLVGRHEPAEAAARRAKELDPFSARINIWLISTYLFSRRYDQEFDVLKQLRELEPNHPLTQYYLGLTYAAMGRYPEAIIALKESNRQGVGSSAQTYLGNVYARTGKREEALAIVHELQQTKQFVSPVDWAILYFGLGEKNQAFLMLEKAYAEHDIGLMYIGADPFFDGARSDPRFQDLLRRVGLPQ